MQQQEISKSSGINLKKMTHMDLERKVDTMQNAFGSTISYLKQSHQGPKIQNPEELIPFGNEQDYEIEDFMRGEIQKYNKLKRQKQKEAFNMYEQEKIRLNLLEKMKYKERRLEMSKLV